MWTLPARAEHNSAQSPKQNKSEVEPGPSELPPPDPPRYSPSYRARLEPESKAESYALSLTIAYLLAPGLALAAGGGLSELEVSDGVAVLGGAAMFVLPAGVHLYNSDGRRAGVSFATMLGMTFAGVLTGGVTGYLIGSRGCEGNEDSDACNRRIGTTIIGAAVGGVVGYVGHAIWDVAARSDVPKTPETSAHGAPLVWFYPSLSRRAEHGQRATELDGFQLGITLSL